MAKILDGNTIKANSLVTNNGVRVIPRDYPYSSLSAAIAFSNSSLWPGM